MKNNHCKIPDIFIHASPRYVGSPDIFPFLRLSTVSSNFKLLNPDDSLHVSEKLAIGSTKVPYTLFQVLTFYFLKNMF